MRRTNFPYPKRDVLVNRFPSPQIIGSFNNPPQNPFQTPYTSEELIINHKSPPIHNMDLFVPEFNSYYPDSDPYGGPHSGEIVYAPDYNFSSYSNELFPRFPHHGQNSSRFADALLPDFPNVNPMETSNPYPSQLPLRGAGPTDSMQADLDFLKASINANDAQQAWLRFYDLRNSPFRIPVDILFDLIDLFCRKDTFVNWPDSYEKPGDILFILVNYLNRHNFSDNEVYDKIMLAFSRIPTNEGLFRCLELLKAYFYVPSRNTLFSIMSAYTNSDLNSKLLELYPILKKNSYTDTEMLIAFFNSLQPIFTTEPNKIVNMLLSIAKEKVIALPRECYIIIIESFISAKDIKRALLVAFTFPPTTQLENSHIEYIILKSPPLLIPKVFRFVEQLNDSQRSMLSQLSYATLIDKSISSNYSYGISYLFGLYINFNKLVDTSLITKLLEFLFRNNHTSQVKKIFKMVESYHTSGEQNSLTNIFLPPTMHKISKLLIEHESFGNLYIFVKIMLNEKIVPLKPVIKGLVEHLKEIKDNTKVNEILDFAVNNELVFDAQIFNPLEEPQIQITQQPTHFTLNIDTPKKDNVTNFNFSLKEVNKPIRTEFLISVIDSMVSTDIPHDHIFNHLLVSLGQSKDILNTFKTILEAFIPGDPDRSPQSKAVINQILLRTAMRLTANFAFEKNWKECITFLVLLNNNSLLDVKLECQYSKELIKFLCSVIEVSVKETNFTEIFKIFDKINWPSFTQFDRSEIPQFKSQLLSLFTQCLEQVDLHSAYRVITYVLQEGSGDENTKSCFVQLLGMASNLGETSIALPLFTFMSTNKLEITIDHFIYQKLITHLAQENRLHQAKMVFQHGVTNSCYTAMLSIMASPNQINLFSNLIPLEMKFLLEKRLQSLYNMHKDVLIQSEKVNSIQPFEISFVRNILTSNRTAFQQSIRSLILMLSEEFTPPLIDNCSEYLKNINYLKMYKIQIEPTKLRQFLLENFVADKDKPSSDITPNNSPDFCLMPGYKNPAKPNTDSPQFLPESQFPYPDIAIKEEVLEDSFSLKKSMTTISPQSAWFCEIKRSINAKLSKFYWGGRISNKEDYNLIAKRVTKTFRENVKIPDTELVAILASDHNEIIDELIQEEILKLHT